MATSAAIATGLLPITTSGTVSLTVSGFGTVDAAIIICSNANSSNNPQDNATICVGFWDGVNSVQHTLSAVSEDGLVSSTDTYRSHINNRIISIYSPTTTQILTDATCAATTDGVILTVGEAKSGVQRYLTAILIKGVTDVHLGSVNLGTGTSAVDITAPAFKPDLVFLSTVGNTTATSGLAHWIFSLGAVHNNSSNVVTQAAVYGYSEDAVSTTDTGNYVTHSYCCGQFFNGSISWQASASDFDANGFSLTPTASAGSDEVSYLAIKLADPDDAWIDIIDMATSTGNDAHTGVGFQPDVVGLVFAGTTTLDSVATNNIFCFGAGDGTTQQCLAAHDQTSVTTTNTNSEADTAKILLSLFGGGTTNAEATLQSLDSDGFTLNYSDSSIDAKKILAFAIGDSTAGGGTTHEVTFTDAISISDALSVSSILGASLAEAVGIADQQSAAVTYEVTILESAALNDAQSVQAVFEVTVAESAAISDTNSVTAIYEVTISPGIGVGDVESYETGNVGTIGEAVGASVTFSAQCIYEVNASESVAINDLQQVAAVFEVALDNGVSITDLEQVQAILNVAVAEGITVNDIIQAALQGAVYYGDRRRISLADGKIRIVLKDKPHKIII